MHMLQQFGTLILDTALPGILLMAAALISLVFLRRSSAAVRHFVLALALGCLVAIPILKSCLPELRVLPRWDSTTKRERQPLALLVPTLSMKESGPAHDGNAVEMAFPGTDGSDQEPEPARMVLGAMEWIGLIWLCGVTVSALPLLLGFWSIARIWRSATRIQAPRMVELLHETVEMFAIKRGIELLEHTERRIPMTWGLMPKVLLPSGCDGWPLERLRQVLMHECAHIVRGDFETRVAAHLIRALFWFNPLVWLAVRRLTAEQELACDDLVLQKGTDAADYAEGILTIAAQQTRRWLEPAAVAMARSSEVGTRIQAILDASRARQPLTAKAALTGTLLFLALTSAVTLLHAQNAEKPQAAADPEAAAPKRSFVRMVAGQSGPVFQGRLTTWEELGRIFEGIPNRPHTVLELAIDSDELTLRQLNEAQAKARKLSEQGGFEYFSYVGLDLNATKALVKLTTAVPVTENDRTKQETEPAPASPAVRTATQPETAPIFTQTNLPQQNVQFSEREKIKAQIAKLRAEASYQERSNEFRRVKELYEHKPKLVTEAEMRMAEIRLLEAQGKLNGMTKDLADRRISLLRQVVEDLRSQESISPEYLEKAEDALVTAEAELKGDDLSRIDVEHRRARREFDRVKKFYDRHLITAEEMERAEKLLQLSEMQLKLFKRN